MSLFGLSYRPRREDLIVTIQMCDLGTLFVWNRNSLLGFQPTALGLAASKRFTREIRRTREDDAGR